MEDPFLARARSLIAEGRVGAARRLLHECVRLNPDDAEAWILLASIAKTSARIGYLEEALRRRPNDRQVQAGLARARMGRAASVKVQADNNEAAGTLGSRHRTNIALLIGGIIVFLVIFLAAAGSRLAPQDPTRSVFILQDFHGVWTKPPFPPFTVPGYIFGSDEQGRDYLSQLLWAIRPTFLLVACVAAVRMAVGLAVGLAAGWLDNGLGRTCSLLISAAVAVPVLIVALGVIALVGIESGVLAFVIGLSASGWGEVARILQTQSRSIRGQAYIEAARALGHSEAGVVWNHVLRQIQPLLPMLLVFQVSDTMLTTAALGFLGYYLGGGVWFQTGDFVMQRIAGTPELGQMLAIAAANRTRPEAMIFAGTAVFIIVLGFSLLGEGLRESLRRERLNDTYGILAPVTAWWQDRALPYVERRWALYMRAGLASAAALLLLAAAAIAVWTLRGQAAGSAIPTTVSASAGGWVTDRHDAQGTLTIADRGPSAGTLAWKWSTPETLTGGPAVSADGTLYVTSDETLFAISSSGKLSWSRPLPGSPVGSPAIGGDGAIYNAIADGSLTAFGGDGASRWTVKAQAKTRAISGPIVGPDGQIYYSTEGGLYAASQSGQILWRSDIPYSYISPIPRLDPSGKEVIFQDILIDAATGKHINTPTDDPLDWYMVGADGRIYLQQANSITEWQPGQKAVQPVVWDLSGFSFGFPTDSGVTPDGFAWLTFITGFQDTRIVWADLHGNVLGQMAVPQRTSRIIGVDSTSTIFVCGINRSSGLQCLAYGRGEQNPSWDILLERGGGEPVGGALAQGRLYLAASAGSVYAIGP